MAPLGFASDLLRPQRGNDAHRVTFIELFFDLVFVFAVTQVSHVLLTHQSVIDLVQTVIMAAVVWFAWINTTWTTNWLNPERGWVRGMLITLMLVGMLMASAIPEAFTDKALLFAIALVTMQLGRSVFTALAFARSRPAHAMNFVRIGIWEAATAVLWIGGALAPEEARLWIWLAAVLIDFSGPRARFWVPGLGRSGLHTWNITGEHMSERVSLFFIIVLGESIIVTGSTFAAAPLEGPYLLAFLSAFVGTVLLWLLYFNHGQQGGSEFISHANEKERGLIAQVAYTYIPLLMVLGIVLTAVGDGLVLREPDEPTDPWAAGLLCGAAALYLLGNAFFRRAVGGPWLVGHLVGAIVLAGLLALYPLLPSLALAWLVNLVLLLVVIADEWVWRRLVARDGRDPRRRGSASPLL
ncbi:low temperature requirement protein A [Leifsonia sp. YAF41]|uniref:low temperature requirement protein A n=1 Tax=Leifsonia sp. YAF41 TaxID=3233086 RepID=UPI003F971602